ncbi:hypothetical protein R1flu_017099 [Riccia fluitans]|uniref:Uncharacterized protein n=1 Tax=Riccia fluitans TaxID=41844 RepID=A0ABD1YP11_9MARC
MVVESVRSSMILSTKQSELHESSSTIRWNNLASEEYSRTSHLFQGRPFKQGFDRSGTQGDSTELSGIFWVFWLVWLSTKIWPRFRN